MCSRSVWRRRRVAQVTPPEVVARAFLGEALVDVDDPVKLPQQEPATPSRPDVHGVQSLGAFVVASRPVARDDGSAARSGDSG